VFRNRAVIGFLGALVACVLLLGAVPALASDAAEVEALIKQALDLRRQQKDPLAYPLLQKAHALGSTPRTAAQLGLVEINLGYWLDAERHLSESLAAKRDVWVNQHRAVLEQNLEKARKAIGEVLVVGTPSGAEIEVNGKAVGTLPMQAPVRLGEGPARIEVRAPGYEPASRSLNVVGGQREQIALALDPAKASATAPAPTSATSPSPAAPPEQPPHPRKQLRLLAWSAAGFATGVLAVAGWQTKTWLDKRDEFDNHLPATTTMPPPKPDCGAKDPDRGGPGCEAIYNDMTGARTKAFILYGLAGAFAAGSATLFILSNRNEESPRLACAPNPWLKGAQCQLVF
jgi:hypothetical protein